MEKNSIFIKIKNFFKNIFNNQKKFPLREEKPDTVKMNATELNKKEFLEIYEKIKNGEADILSIDPDVTEKMCILLEEEIKLKQKLLDNKIAQIVQIDKDMDKLKSAI